MRCHYFHPAGYLTDSTIFGVSGCGGMQTVRFFGVNNHRVDKNVW